MLKALLEKRAGMQDQIKALVEAAEAEDRDLTEDEQVQFNALEADITNLDARITRAQTLAGIQENAPAPAPAAANGGPTEEGGADGFRNAPGANAGRTREGFESIGEFLATVARNPNDQRLAGSYVERMAADDQRMDDGPSGGFAVPSQFREELLMVQPQDAMFRPRATPIPAGSPPDSSVTMPALDQDTPSTGSVRGGVTVSWAGEGATAKKTDGRLRQITLEPKEVTASMDLTNKLLRNWQSGAAIMQRLMRDALIAAEEDTFLNGNGVTRPLGVLNAGATITEPRAGAVVTYDALANMLGKLLMRGGTPIWSISQSELPALMKLRDNDDTLIWQSNARDGFPGTLMGYPVVYNEHQPLVGNKGSILLANPSYYLIKDGSGPFVEASPHVRFRENITVFKCMWNVDGQPWLTAPFKQEKGFQVSPFVQLGAAT